MEIFINYDTDNSNLLNTFLNYFDYKLENNLSKYNEQENIKF